MRFTRLIAVLLIAVSAAGCQASGNDTAEKSGTGELRTDLEPLAKRFPVLDEAEHARWMSGTFGSDRVPGPSTYWIDAVVVLSGSKIDELRSGCAPESAGKSPEVVDGLRGELPGGPFVTGDCLDRAFNHDKWVAKAYLVPDRRTVVLVATGT
ncbi:MAG TPA: hypothetical protein VF821_09545 [Lentzea sp.]